MPSLGRSNLHERLLAARKAAGYQTATDAARSIGTSYPTYAGHENGSSGFRHKTAAVYARKFGVSLEWLLTGRGGMGAKIENSELAEIIEMLRDASPEVLTAVRTLLEQQLAPVSFGSAAFERTK
jgi:DNA-binding XRE family transcriptional regulator